MERNKMEGGKHQQQRRENENKIKGKIRRTHGGEQMNETQQEEERESGDEREKQQTNRQLPKRGWREV